MGLQGLPIIQGNPNHSHTFTPPTITGPSPSWIEAAKRDLTEQIYRESPLLKRLNDEVERTRRDIARSFDRQLWGDSPNMNLRESITDALDKHMPHLNKQEEEMDTRAIVAEAAKERTTKLAEQYLDEFWAYFNATEWTSGDTVSWRAKFPNSDKTYNYVAVRGGELWYTTNIVGARTDAQLIEELVRIKIDAVEFSWDGDE